MIIRSETKGDKFYLTHGEDMSDVIEHNKYLRENSPSKGYDASRNYRFVGEVPILIWHEYLRKYPELIHGDRVQRDRIIRKIFNEHPEFRGSEGRF